MLKKDNEALAGTCPASHHSHFHSDNKIKEAIEEMRTKKNKAETVEEVNEAVHLMHKKIEAIKHHHGTESAEESSHHSPANHSHKDADISLKHHGKPAHHDKSESKEHNSCENSEKKVTEDSNKSNKIVDMINGLVKDAVSSNSGKSHHKLDKIMNESIANRVHGLNDKQ